MAKHKTKTASQHKQRQHEAGGLIDLASVVPTIDSLLQREGHDKSGEGAVLADLPLGQPMQQFADVWWPIMMQTLAEAFDALHPSVAPRSRVITFSRTGSGEDPQGGWDFAGIAAVSAHNTLDANDLKRIMDEEIGRLGQDRLGLAVWLVPASSSKGWHAAYVRVDEANELMILSQTTNSDAKTLQVLGAKRIEVMLRLMFESSTDRLAAWIALGQDLAEGILEDEFVAAEKLLIPGAFGASEEERQDRWSKLIAHLFINEQVVHALMEASRLHSRAVMAEAQCIAGAAARRRTQCEAEIKSIRESASSAREREKKRFARDVELARLQAKGAREMADRFATQLRELQARMASGAGSERESSLSHPGFEREADCPVARQRMHQAFNRLFAAA